MTLTIIPIASLPEATIVNDDDYLVMSQGGVTKKVKYSTVFDDIGARGLKITTHAFVIEDITYEYTASQYEFIESIVLKGIASGESATIDYYTLNLATGLYEANSIVMEDSNVLNLNNYFDSSETFERVIAISPSANCTIIIKSAEGL